MNQNNNSIEPMSISDEEQYPSTTISTISEFLDKLIALKEDGKSERFFRGHADRSWKLEAGVYRLKPASKKKQRGRRAISNENYHQDEHKMFRELVARHSNEFSNCTSTIEYLVKMQHYGLPTRLLDITANPLVALYFACCEHSLKEGEIIIFDVPTDDIKHYESDTISVLSNISKCEGVEINLFDLNNEDECFYDSLGLNQTTRSNLVEFSDYERSLSKKHTKAFNELVGALQEKRIQGKRHVSERLLKKFNDIPYIQLLLHQIRFEKPHFRSIIDPYDISKIWVSQVKLNNPRIQNQAGAFFVMGLGCEQNGHEILLTKRKAPEIPKKWIKERIRINPRAKANILKGLKTLGITKSFLFPEIDIYASELREKYKKPNTLLFADAEVGEDVVEGVVAGDVATCDFADGGNGVPEVECQ